MKLFFPQLCRGSKGRTTWYFVHWILGTTTCLVGILNIYTGLEAYHKRSSRNTSVWTIIFTAQLSFMMILYLFQDKWDYITRQGNGINIDIGNHPNNPLPSSSQQVEDNMLNEACRKSNALGTHFSRTNALNKLFQLTWTFYFFSFLFSIIVIRIWDTIYLVCNNTILYIILVLISCKGHFFGSTFSSPVFRVYFSISKIYLNFSKVYFLRVNCVKNYHLCTKLQIKHHF